MVLQTLAVMGPMHGYGLAPRIEQISQEALRVNQGTIYPDAYRAGVQAKFAASSMRPDPL